MKSTRHRGKRKSVSEVPEAKRPRMIADEVRYITERAAARDTRLVVLGGLVFFSTATGDAWVLDSEDGFALCLALDGEAQPVNIEETPEQFAMPCTA
jgi:hypothetical protein